MVPCICMFLPCRFCLLPLPPQCRGAYIYISGNSISAPFQHPQTTDCLVHRTNHCRCRWQSFPEFHCFPPSNAVTVGSFYRAAAATKVRLCFANPAPLDLIGTQGVELLIPNWVKVKVHDEGWTNCLLNHLVETEYLRAHSEISEGLVCAAGRSPRWGSIVEATSQPFA